MIEKIKLMVSEMIHKLNYVRPKEDSQGDIISNLKKQGYHVIEEFVDANLCAKLRKEADSFIEQNMDKVKMESNDSDMRVYGVDRYTDTFSIKALDDLSQILFNKFSWAAKPDHFMLLGKIVSSETNLGSGGGWHRDSPFRHQFKTILYLSDVTEENGPFQYIPNTHKYGEVKKVGSHLGIDLEKRRFADDEIDTIVKNGVVVKPKTFTAKAGSVIIVDTRGLHRGMPLRKDKRYALTNYHFENGVNQAFFNKK